jgi:hypothetical protein
VHADVQAGRRHVAAISAVHPRRTVATQIRPPRRGHAQMAAAAAARASHPQLLFYHDGRHPLIYMYEPPITSEQYQQAIDELIGTPVDGLCFCLGDGRTVLHATQVGERWGHHFTETGEQWSHDIFRRAAQNMEHLLASGVDPLRCVCERAAAKGLPIYPALLVNQGSGDSYVDDTRTSDFWLRSAHLRIGSKTTDMGALPMWFDQETSGRCLDFMHAEVRDERFALVEETLRSYACAGFELQLNYHTHYFHPSEVVKGCEVMTAWIKRCHTAVKASGADRLLIVRVPASLNGCRSRGLDVEAWLQLGIVDVLAAQVLSGPELHESSCPDFRALVAAADAAGGRCSVLATLQSHVDSDRVQEAPIEMVRGAACNYYAQGVHGLYLAHWFNNWPFEASFYEKLRELPDVDVMAPKDKIVFVSTETGRYSTSQLGAAALEPGLRLELPRFFRPSTLAPSSDSGTPAAALGSWPSSETPGTIVVHFSMSDDLPRAAAEERLFSVVLRVRVTGEQHAPAAAQLQGERFRVA